MGCGIMINIYCEDAVRRLRKADYDISLWVIKTCPYVRLVSDDCINFWKVRVSIVHLDFSLIIQMWVAIPAVWTPYMSINSVTIGSSLFN
jgi:hypothetical protein